MTFKVNDVYAKANHVEPDGGTIDLKKFQPAGRRSWRSANILNGPEEIAQPMGIGNLTTDVSSNGRVNTYTLEDTGNGGLQFYTLLEDFSHLNIPGLTVIQSPWMEKGKGIDEDRIIEHDTVNDFSVGAWLNSQTAQLDKRGLPHLFINSSGATINIQTVAVGGTRAVLPIAQTGSFTEKIIGGADAMGFEIEDGKSFTYWVSEVGGSPKMFINFATGPANPVSSLTSSDIAPGRVTEDDNKLASAKDAKDNKDDIDAVVARLLTEIRPIATAENNKSVSELAIRTALDGLSFEGKYHEAASTFATLAAHGGKAGDPTNKDITVLLVDDLGAGTKLNPQYPAGLYMSTGAIWTFVKSIPEFLVLTDQEITSKTGDDYAKPGAVSASSLDKWGVSRRVQRIFNVTADFDFTALGYSNKTAIYVRNTSSINGVNVKYGSSGAITREITLANGVLQSVPNEDSFNLQPNEIAFMEQDGNTFRVSIIPGERVVYFSDYADAVLKAPSRVAFDSIVVIRSKGEIWGRKTTTNSAAFPADGVTNADWFKLGLDDRYDNAQPYVAGMDVPKDAYVVYSGTDADHGLWQATSTVTNAAADIRNSAFIFRGKVSVQDRSRVLPNNSILSMDVFDLETGKTSLRYTIRRNETATFTKASNPNIIELINEGGVNVVRTNVAATSSEIVVTGPAEVEFQRNSTQYNWIVKSLAGSSSTNRIFDSIADTDNEPFKDGEEITTRSEGEGAVTWIFELGATEGDYEISDVVSGYFNKQRNQTQSILLEEDGGAGEPVSFSQSDPNFGDFVNDMDPTAKYYFIKRHPNSTQAQTFQSGVDTIIPADDFDWYQFRRINSTTVEFMGKPFQDPKIYGVVASNEIGTLKQVPNRKDDGSLKTNQDYLDEGLLPLVNSFTYPNGAAKNPRFAAMFPSFVSGQSIVVPNSFNGSFIRNLGGNAAAFLALQADATAVNGLRTLRTYVQSDWNGQSNNDFGKGSGSLTGAANNGVGMSSSDNETRPHNFAMQFCLVLDSYAESLFVDAALVEVGEGRVEIPVGDTSIVSDTWSLTDLGFDPSAVSGRLIVECDLADIEIELPMRPGKEYFSGLVNNDPAWQTRASHQGGNNLGVATGRISTDGGTTTLTRIWYYPPALTVTRAKVIDPLDTPHNNEFVVTGEKWDGKQVFGRVFNAKLTDATLGATGEVVFPSGLASYHIRKEGQPLERRTDEWDWIYEPSGRILIKQRTNADRNFAASSNSNSYYTQKLVFYFIK